MRILLSAAKNLPAFILAFIKHREIGLVLGLVEPALIMSLISFALIYPFYRLAMRLVRETIKIVWSFRRRIVFIVKAKRFKRKPQTAIKVDYLTESLIDREMTRVREDR